MNHVTSLSDTWSTPLRTWGPEIGNRGFPPVPGVERYSVDETSEITHYTNWDMPRYRDAHVPARVKVKGRGPGQGGGVQVQRG